MKRFALIGGLIKMNIRGNEKSSMIWLISIFSPLLIDGLRIMNIHGNEKSSLSWHMVSKYM